MLKKIVAIKNVGRFSNYSASGDVEFRKMTFIFGENGRGKSTLTSIFRCVRNGDADSITSRTRLPSSGPPEIKILSDQGVIDFRSGSWTSSLQDIEVFDAHFIDDNVCSGLQVDHEHKRNLYRVIVGEVGVSLSQKVDELDARIRTINSELKEKKADLKAFVIGGYDVDKFIGLSLIQGIDQLIKEKQEELDAVKHSAEISAKPLLSEIHLPSVPSVAVLGKTLEHLSTETASRVLRQAKSLGAQGEKWIAEGVGYLEGECPFCTQSVRDVEIVSDYQNYFSEEYENLKKDIEAHSGDIDDAFGPESLLVLQKSFNGNSTLTEFWKQFSTIPLFSLEMEDIVEVIRELHKQLKAKALLKSGSPLEAVELDESFNDAVRAFNAMNARVSDYNVKIRAVNELAKEIKAKAKGGDLATVSSELMVLQNTKKRHEPTVDKACEEVEGLKTNKADCEREKRDAKRELDHHSSSIFNTYESSMNRHLQLFGADFRIANTAGTYQGGRPNSKYCISINNCDVSVEASPGIPSFKTTLSGGDKSCLALAFFLAQLDHDPRIQEKVVVFDDPISSMDRFRADRTVRVIRELATKAKQVIVLSHDPHFLRRLWEDTTPSERRAILVRRVGQDSSTIEDWEIVKSTRSDYLQDYFALAEFLEHGTGAGAEDLRNLARKIRPLLEENLRMRFPDIFGSGQWLGDFIQEIRNSSPGDIADAMRSSLTELTEINDYSKKYHHSDNVNAVREPITDGELRVHAERTLTFLRGQPT